ncbi:MAG TPA: glycosyltransferase family 39 protein [Acidimicrobiales bacterium]|nr:glycosyltransferase family 39 protein [Acidimicrobiales bacterium]
MPTPRPTEVSPADRRDGLPPWLIATFAAAGVALRWFVMAGPLGSLDSDEAVSALVSREIQNGDIKALIPGLRAGGTLLAFPRAVVFELTGANTVAAKLCEIAVFAAACVVVWRIGRRVFSERHGQIAALLMWIYPAATVWESTKVRLYYTVAVLLVALGMLVALRLYDSPDGARAARDVAAFGVIGGLCVWTHPMALYAFLPTFVWLVVCRPALARRAPLFVASAVGGALPWLVYNARFGWESLRQPPGAVPSTFSDRFEGFFGGLLPRLTGFRHFVNGPWFLSPWSTVLFLALGVSAVIALVRWRGKRTLLLAICVGYPVLFAIPRNSVFVAEARYGLPFVPALATIASALIIWISRARVVAITAVLALAAIVTALSVQRVIDDSEAFAVQHTVLRPISTDPVWDAIADRNLDATYAEYWLAYRLVFQDRRDVVVIPTSSDYYDLGGRHPEGADAAFFYGGSLCLVRWLEVLKDNDLTATTEPVGDYVLVRTEQPVPVAMIAAAMADRC